MYTFKYKDSSPEKTIEKCKNILKELGIEVEEKISEYAPGLFSALIFSRKTGEFSNGKGISKKYCLASGYAEFLERLQNQLFTRYLHHTSTSFDTFPDEKKISFTKFLLENEDIAKDLKQLFILSKGREPLNISETVYIFQRLYNFNEDDLITVPFYSIRKKETTDLPFNLLSEITGTSGECAGNTPKEAISQGICEILERWAEFVVTHNNLTPPRIKESWLEENYPDQFEEIQSLKKSNPNLTIEILDFSLANKVPVVGTLVIDKEHSRYRLQMGSHPLFNIALERCCTEMVQGINLKDEVYLKKNFKYFSVESSLKAYEAFNSLSRIEDGIGSLPLAIFGNKESWEFEPWPLINDYDSNKGFDYLKKICLNLSPDIYIRDNSFLGFPSYYIYIPQLSILPITFNDSTIGNPDLKWKLGTLPYDYRTYTEEELKEISDFLMSNYGSRILPAEDSCDTSEEIQAALHLATGNTSEALSLLRELAMADKKYMGVISDIELSLLNIPEEERDSILKRIYDEETVQYCLNKWRGNILENFFLPIVNSGYALIEDVDIINKVKQKLSLKLLSYSFDQNLKGIL